VNGLESIRQANVEPASLEEKATVGVASLVAPDSPSADSRLEGV
jgi:hypothetical protein